MRICRHAMPAFLPLPTITTTRGSRDAIHQRMTRPLIRRTVSKVSEVTKKIAAMRSVGPVVREMNRYSPSTTAIVTQPWAARFRTCEHTLLFLLIEAQCAEKEIQPRTNRAANITFSRVTRISRNCSTLPAGMRAMFPYDR